MIVTYVLLLSFSNCIILVEMFTLLDGFFPLVTDVPQMNLKRSKAKESVKNKQIKKRKKKHEDYQPNYFLSIPITNQKVLLFKCYFYCKVLF